jgi:hypothetical protein
MGQNKKSCCVGAKDGRHKGVLPGVLYGLIPHSFCIAFAVFSIVGATAATVFLKKFLLVPNLFVFLVLISLLLATVSAVIYLKKSSCLCVSGIKSKRKYIAITYLSTILVNLLMFFVVLPAIVNLNAQKVLGQEGNFSELSIDVQIPCSGHASLIIDEIKKNCDVRSVEFRMPGNFDIKYDPQKTTPEKIAGLEIFKTYPAKIN